MDILLAIRPIINLNPLYIFLHQSPHNWVVVHLLYTQSTTSFLCIAQSTRFETLIDLIGLIQMARSAVSLIVKLR